MSSTSLSSALAPSSCMTHDLRYLLDFTWKPDMNMISQGYHKLAITSSFLIVITWSKKEKTERLPASHSLGAPRQLSQSVCFGPNSVANRPIALLPEPSCRIGNNGKVSKSKEGKRKEKEGRKEGRMEEKVVKEEQVVKEKEKAR